MTSSVLDKVLEWSVVFSLSVVHGSLWLKNACTVLLGYVVTAFSYSWKKFAKEEDNYIDVVRADAKSLEKLPTHLAVAVLEDCELDHESLARLAVWCFAAGVHHVSLYDPQGKLKLRFDHLRKALASHYHTMFGPLAPSPVVSKKDPSARDVFIGVESSYSVQVLSSEDAHSHMVETARELCRAVQRQEIGHDQIDVSVVEQRCKGNSGMPDPDLLVVFGNATTTGGYPPWRMRFSEIHFLRTHRSLSYKTVLSTLQAFARCKQNFGK